MKFSLSHSLTPSKDTELLVIPFQSSRQKRSTSGSSGSKNLFDIVDRQLKGRLKDLLKKRNFTGESGKSVLLNTVGPGNVHAILLFAIDDQPSPAQLQQLGVALWRTAEECRCRKALLDAQTLPFQDSGAVESFLEGVLLGSYSFNTYKSQSGENSKFRGLREISIYGISRLPSASIRKVTEINEGIVFARNLANMPASDCTPSYMAKAARDMARERGLQCKVYGKADLERLQAGAILSVAKGSREEPCLINLVYKGGNREGKKIGLVGKGVTFDSGGICIKPAPGMDEMKFDMAGAAAVLGVMLAVGALKPACEIRAYVSVSENMVDGNATHPGDVVRAMNGTTIEVVNTDAEGRLLLADAISLAQKDGCDEIIDIATLTGAIVVALGMRCAGLFCSDDALANGLLAAAEKSGEALWRMPLIDEYREQLKSRIADMKNIGDKAMGGGAVTGALFLRQFVSSASWAHLDIAGPAAKGGGNDANTPGATGYGVRTLVRYILSA